MPSLNAVQILLALIQGSRDKIVDKLTGKPPAIPRGNGVRLRCGIFISDPTAASLVDDLSNIASVTCQVRKDGPLGEALFDKTIAIGDFDNTGLTWLEWDGKTDQHFSVELTAEETGQAMPSGKTELPIYIAFEAHPVSGDPIFLGSITTVIFEDGIGSSGSPVVGDPTYLTAAESDARYARRGHGMPDWRPDITGHTGDAATDLDSLDSVDLDLGYLILINPALGLQGWVLTEGTPAEDVDAGIILPHDHTAETNEKYWHRKF